ncbi:MAG: DNA starvation/stationary phase protection protein [Cellulophaga sp.]|uniref:Dps family protein n=1 Tax=unclassified Cellulophaga TaxID=2634405 RepID=UPI0026E47EF3|nr:MULTISPECIES: DNA starvation/stationary phase protection protein [unclassified Cellulophaga]MDO6489977.1 DNA starvation/stationary phase protection protein [Cellulophaga sp. 2_MG-2023]MDO6494829.1 DNA starvation/stationary phase protection protein [Cellulophaga sp. 3_MG-2023]
MNYLNISDNKLVPVVGELNMLLADYSVYYQKLRSFHWNVLGQNFFDLHVKFEELYTDARIKIDAVAERVLTLRYHPVSNFSKYLKISSIEEVSPLITDTEMVAEILSDHQKILKQMKTTIEAAEEAGDEGTMDMMGSYIADLEKSSWMLDAWRKNTEDQLKIRAKEMTS